MNLWILAAGIYLILVGYKGNADGLFTQLQQSGGFLQFGGAAAILYGLYSIKAIQPVMVWIIALVAVALALRAYSSGALQKVEKYVL